MVASRTFKCALIVIRLVGWLDTSKPHSLTAFRTWRLVNRLRRIVDTRLLHGALPLRSTGGSAICLSATDAWDRAAVSMMLAFAYD